MDIVPIEIYGVSVDLPLPKPLSMRDPALEEFVQALCDPQLGIGLRPSQAQLVNRDWLYPKKENGNEFPSPRSAAV